MLAQWLQLQWIILPILAIPLAILLGARLGARRPTGAIIISSIGALLAIAFRWYRSAIPLLTFTASGYNLLDSIVNQTPAILLLAGWTLALAHTAQARRWRWSVALIVAGYVSYDVNLLADVVRLNPCAFSSPDVARSLACLLPNQELLLLLALGQAVGPILALIYALRAPGRRQRQLPEGLVVSSLRAQKTLDERAISAD